MPPAPAVATGLGGTPKRVPRYVFTTSASAVRYATVAYWSPSAKLEGLVRQPEPQPPRTA